MIVVGYQLVPSYQDLWTLAAHCEALLGSGADLMAMGEDAAASSLDPWPSFPRQSWSQGRLFGSQGELHWRAYGALVRAAVLVDASLDPSDQEAALQTIRDLGFEGVAALSLEPQDSLVQLWRRSPYTHATVRSYLDDGAAPCFVRYCGVEGV